MSSSFVGRRGRTNVNSEEERSVKNRRCRTPGCIVVDCDCGIVLECNFVVWALYYTVYFFFFQWRDLAIARSESKLVW